MATLQQMMSNVYTLLNDPLPQSPSPRHVWKAVLLHTQDFFNRLNNTGKAWATGEYSLDVSAGTGDYLIASPPNFGKPLVVLTTDPNNAAHWERTLDVYDFQNLDFAYEGPMDGANLARTFIDGSHHSARAIAFYRKLGNELQLYARIRPVPQESATYTVIYSVGNWVETAGLTSSPILSEFHDLIELRAALSLLPACAWFAGDSDEAWKKNRERRQELMQARQYEDARITPNFERYVSTMRSDKLNLRVPYGYLD